MTRRAGLALFFSMALLFLIANRGAYKGYFQDDELDNISWAPYVEKSVFLQGLLAPKFLSGNFRPVGHFYFYFMGRHFGLDFPKYVFPIHALHLLNVWLIWLVARRLGATPFAAGAASLFFAFNMAVFDVLWKPMYVFDLLCATFCLASLLFYTRRWLIASFVAFWLAYKSKELAVMLPAVLAVYEYWFGERRWIRLLPFAAASCVFGVQGVLYNPNKNNDYTFHFDPASILKTIGFYSSAVLLVPLAGLVLPLVAWLSRDRIVRFGIAAMLLFFLPLGFLSLRTFNAYCYLPLIGLALAVAGLAMTPRRVWVAGFFLLWLPWNEYNLIKLRRRALAADDENRTYVQAVSQAAARHPNTRSFIYDGAPKQMNVWGIEGALRLFYHSGEIHLTNIEDKNAQHIMESGPIVILSWDSPRRTLAVAARDPGQGDFAYIRMNHATPLWQLGEGWYGLENTFRWTQPKATARLYRPVGALQFELVVNISPDLLRDLNRPGIAVLLNGRPLAARKFDGTGWQTARWDLEPAPAGTVTVEFRADPPYHPPAPDNRVLGASIVSFGFIAKENP